LLGGLMAWLALLAWWLCWVGLGGLMAWVACFAGLVALLGGLLCWVA
jgi:hypothetical protein